MGTKDRDALKLTSMAPLDDGGRKYNIIYFIAVVVGILLGIFAGNGITSIVVATLMALIVALVIKNSILDFKWKGLRQQKFLLEKRVPYDFLIHHLITQLSSLNFQVEKGADGSPVLTRKKMIYDIEYGEDNTFTIYWRKSLVNAVFDFKTSIYHYRNTVADMGIIGYAVQTICCENAFGVGQQNLQNNTQSGFASDVQGNPPIRSDNSNNGQNIPEQENIAANEMNAVQMNQNPYVGYARTNIQDKRKHTGVFVAIAIVAFVVLAGGYWLATLSDEESLELEDDREGQFEADLGEENINKDTEYVQNDLFYGLNEAVSFELKNGGQISVTFTKYGEKEDTAYIHYEIENIGNTAVTVGESMFSVYANDYAAELNFGANTIYEETISVGRKVSGTLYPNMLLDKVKRLEIECGDVIFLLRDTSAVDAMLGTYYRQYEEDGNIVVDEIKLYREVYNNDGLAISVRQHIDFGNDYDYDYDYNSWVFELHSDRIEFINHSANPEGLTVYYSPNPREEGIDVVESEVSEIEDMFTGHYEWTDNIQAVYETIENDKQPEQSAMSSEGDFDSEVQGFSYQPNGNNDYLGAYSSIIEDVVASYGEYCEYTLYDLDGDGIKELITSVGTCDADWSNVVYTLEDGYVSMIGDFYGLVMLYVAEDGNGLYAVSGGMEYQNIDQITKNGNQLQVETIMSGEIGVEEDYYSNDNPVSFNRVTDDSLLRQ